MNAPQNFKTLLTFSEKNNKTVVISKVFLSTKRKTERSLWKWFPEFGGKTTYLDAVVALLVDNRDIRPAHALDYLDHGLHLIVVRWNGAWEVLKALFVAQLGAGGEVRDLCKAKRLLFVEKLFHYEVDSEKNIAINCVFGVRRENKENELQLIWNWEKLLTPAAVSRQKKLRLSRSRQKLSKHPKLTAFSGIVTAGSNLH